MTTYDGFRVERDGAVATITLDVPGKLNRVSMPARDQLGGVRGPRADAVGFVVSRVPAGRLRLEAIAGFLERSP